MDVIVAGGGIGGLTTALSLDAAGIRATVLESVAELRPLGVGINLQPHAVRELVELGLGAELAETAVATAELVYADNAGHRILDVPTGLDAGYPWPQYSVHRGRLQMILLSAVRDRLGPDAVRTGVHVDDFEERQSGVRVRCRTSAGVEQVAGDLLVGADGLHSAVRSRLRPDEGPPCWSGVRMWRGATIDEPFLTGRSMVHADDGARVRFIVYPMSRPDSERGRPLVNWVCQYEDTEAADADPADWSRPGRRDDVLPLVADWRLGWLDVPGLVARTEDVYEYPMVDRNPLRHWSHDRVTLLGDAAHPMYPVGANGASQAIVDARVLAHHLATTPDPATGIARYEQERRPATEAVLLAGREMDEAERSIGRPADPTATYRKISDAYRDRTGASPDALRNRRSLTP